jgi:hypothetical protein
MAHTYYTRLTLVHPEDQNKLDPRRGVVIAETATTGRFILSDITWNSAISPNATSSVAYIQQGEIKIQEPLGMSLMDYIRAAAYNVGCENHLDARFILEMEVLAEDYLEANTPFKYIWPIMFITTEVKGSFSEKGTEYAIQFVQSGAHSQTDLVQAIKETITVDGVSNLKEYFDGLQKKLEQQEFVYAAARQKAGSSSAPGGKNPAASDPFHDEYHFILEPRLDKFTLTNNGKAGEAVKGSWGGIGAYWPFNSFNVSIRPGSTIIQQITKILQSTKEVSELLPGRPQPATKDATGSSDRARKQLQDNLGEIYQFFRVETSTVYKAYDYIRARYAVKHIFLVYLADQPTMYQYPDEIDLLNKKSNKDRAVARLNEYITRGLLQKLYYHNYTGLNTDIIKVDLQFNQAYALPSFPVLWADRGATGPGAMNVQNYNRRINPFNHRDDRGARQAVNRLRAATSNIVREMRQLENDKGKPKDDLSDADKAKYIQLKKDLANKEKELIEREKQLQAVKQDANSQNTINNRSELLQSLNYAEDIDFKEILDDYLENNFPNLHPRMEPDATSEEADIVQTENEKLMQKIFSVMLSPRDLLEIEIEIIADPFWLGMPNLLLQGKNDLSKIELPTKTADELRSRINTQMSKIDPEWNTKQAVWGDYGGAPWYKGSSVFFFNSQVPDPVFTEDDMLQFNDNDQIVGIYQVYQVINEFKNGLWTQKLKGIRDLTIPSHILPKGLSGQKEFEAYKERVKSDPEQAANEKVIDSENKQQRRSEELADEKLKAEPVNSAAATSPKFDQAKFDKALAAREKILAKNPPPAVKDPVAEANSLVAAGESKTSAFVQARATYLNELTAYNMHMNKVDKQAYAEAGISDYKPYNAETMTALAMTRSGAGGLDDWKNNNSNNKSPATNKNPMGIGYNSSNNSYSKYKDFNEGLKEGNAYFNYGKGVKSVGKQGQDRLLVPGDYTGSQLQYVNNKLRGGG